MQIISLDTKQLLSAANNFIAGIADERKRKDAELCIKPQIPTPVFKVEILLHTNLRGKQIGFP
jgi:hypothetical protein